MENLVWLTLVVAVSAAAMLALALLPTFDPGIAFAAAGACLAFSVLRLWRVLGPSAGERHAANARLIGRVFGERAKVRVESAQRRMRARDELARRLGVTVPEIMQREKSGAIHLEQ